MDPQDVVPRTWGQFKDWAFLAASTLLVSILINSIYRLDESVRALSDRLGEKSGELSAAVADMANIKMRQDRDEERLNYLERKN